MFKTPGADTVTEFRGDPFSKDFFERFIKATGSGYIAGVPPTIATVLRQSEYQWLERLNVEMRHLLHADQEYEYRSAVPLSCEPYVRTRLLDLKERKAKNSLVRFIRVESEVSFEGEICIVGRTTFVVRSPAD